MSQVIDTGARPTFPAVDLDKPPTNAGLLHAAGFVADAVSELARRQQPDGNGDALARIAAAFERMATAMESMAQSMSGSPQ